MSRLALFFPALLVACSAGRDDAVSAPLGDASTDDGSLGDVSLDDGGSTLDVLLDEDGGGSPPTCKGLQCQQVKCPDGTTTTTITGTVFNPAKTDPLYNAVVYVPNAPVDAFKPGVTCEKCGVASGEPIVSALSGSDGKFRLENVPVGDNIPLVIQIGRWRRQVVIPKIEACTNNAVGPDLTRLPKNQKEGDIPLTAIVTSTYDPTECILRKIGIDDSEFTVNTGKGRIHIYHGNGETLGASTPAGAALWGDLATLKKYDLVAFPCSSVATDAPSKQNVVNYADAGGRVFATDLSYPWVDASAPTPWNGAATWGSGSTTNPFAIDTTFPKGKALAEWLQKVGATTTLGQINLTGTFARSTGVLGATQRWISNSSTVQHFTFNAPVGKPAESQCGRVVYSSFHIASGGGSGTFPASCTTAALTPQEKVLEFMLFDLASCVLTDKEVPKPPPVK